MKVRVNTACPHCGDLAPKEGEVGAPRVAHCDACGNDFTMTIRATYVVHCSPIVQAPEADSEGGETE